LRAWSRAVLRNEETGHRAEIHQFGTLDAQKRKDTAFRLIDRRSADDLQQFTQGAPGAPELIGQHYGMLAGRLVASRYRLQHPRLLADSIEESFHGLQPATSPRIVRVAARTHSESN